jgi:K+/H+ antiporter YhaU regulatory subunit KhtT
MAIVSNIVAKLKIDNSQFNSGIEKSKQKVSGFGSSLKSIGGLMAGAFSVAAITKFASASLKAYDKQQQAEARLLVALKGRADVQQRLIQLAQQRQQVTLYGDEETIQAEALLAKMGLQETAIKKLIPLVQDLATIQGMSLATAADLVGKSVGSSTNALTRYGIVIEGAVGSADRLNSAVKALNQQVGGQSEAAANTGTGAIKQLSNAWGDLMESVGKWLANPATIALLKSLTTYIGGMAGKMAEVKKYNDSGVLTKKWLSSADLKSLQTELDIVTKKMNTFKRSYEQAKAEGNKDKEGFYAGVWDIERENVEKLIKALDNLRIKRTHPTAQLSTVAALGPQLASVNLGFDESSTTQLTETNTQLKEMAANLLKVQSSSLQAGNGIQGMSDKMVAAQQYTQMLSGMLQQLVQAGIQGLADVIVTAIEGGDVLGALGSFLSNLGKLLVSFGTALITYGIGFKALKNPATAIPAGIALVAAGIALGAIGGAIANTSPGGGSGGGSYSVGSATAQQNYGMGTDYFRSGTREIVLRAKGTDLVGVLNLENSKSLVNG